MKHFDMKGDWEARAKEDAHKAIACDSGRNEALFRESGKRDLQLVLDGALETIKNRESALEIGCGTGRLLEPLATYFNQLYGVDISGEMVKRGRERLAHMPQIHLLEIDGLGTLPFKDGTFDFCFSYITFHHIPMKPVVLRFISEARRVLKPGGIARLHFFGRPVGLMASIRERFTHKSTWRGYKFTLPEITSATKEAGFATVHEEYVPAQAPSRFFGKTPPDLIWITAWKA